MFLSCPTLSHLIKNLFGISVPLPFPYFGFNLAFTFVITSIIFYYELKRKEKEGVLKPFTKKVLVGEPAKASELILSAIAGFLIGWKLIGMIIEYSKFTENPQYYIISLEGSIIGGIIIAVISAFWVYWEKNKKKKAQTERVDEVIHPYQLTANIMLVIVVSAIIGSKLFHVFEYFGDFLDDPVNTLFSCGGLTFYGGLIVAVIAGIIYARMNKIPVLILLDVAAPILMLGYGLGRIGCQVSGDGCWGIIAQWGDNMPKFLPQWFFAYDFPHNVVNEGVLIEGCRETGERYCHVLSQHVYPTSLWEMSVCIILGLLLFAFRKKITIHGVMFSIYLILAGIERYFIEEVRVNPPVLYKFTQAQVISFFLVILGIIGIIYFVKRKKTCLT